MRRNCERAFCLLYPRNLLSVSIRLSLSTGKNFCAAFITLLLASRPPQAEAHHGDSISHVKGHNKLAVPSLLSRQVDPLNDSFSGKNAWGKWVETGEDLAWRRQRHLLLHSFSPYLSSLFLRQLLTVDGAGLPWYMHRNMYVCDVNNWFTTIYVLSLWYVLGRGVKDIFYVHNWFSAMSPGRYP